MFSAGTPIARSALAVAVQISRRERGSERVAGLRPVDDVGAVLAPQLVAGRGDAAGGAVEDLDGAGAGGRPDALSEAPRRRGRPRPSPLRSAAASAAPNESPPSDASSDAGAVLGPQLVAGRGQPAAGAVDHVDRAGAGGRSDAVAGRPDGEVVLTVAVQVGGRERCPEPIAGRGAALDPAAALAQDLMAARRQPVGRAVEDVDGAGVVRRAQVLAGGTDRQIREAVVVEVGDGDRRPEPVTARRRLAAAEVVLGKGLVAGVAEAAAGAVDHVDGAGVGRRPHVLARRTDREVGIAVAIEVARGSGGRSSADRAPRGRSAPSRPPTARRHR